MSKQKFDAAFKSALWEVHGKRCIHCREPKFFKEIEVDHLVPERLLDHPDEFAQVRLAYGLPNDFDIKGRENLAPSCDGCNETKRAGILPPGILGIMLTNIKDALPKLEAKLSEKRQEKDLDDILRMIMVSLDKQKFSREQFQNGLKAANLMHLQRSEFSDRTVLRAIVENGEASTIVFTRHAMERMRERGISSHDVIQSLRHPTFAGYEERILAGQSRTVYRIQARDGLEIVFANVEGRTVVLSCLWQDRATQKSS
ncbi:DUF4258 domain-containing protein [Microvirga sp. 2TAF3]|uniref:DUF4258 domain-containing protein n=1 Tax=Microvirga sp. 2TAF3 TaxID=3233014 RepID=UPI003F9B6B1F